MKNKTTYQETLDFFKIGEAELNELLQTYTLEEIRERGVKVNGEIQVVPKLKARN